MVTSFEFRGSCDDAQQHTFFGPSPAVTSLSCNSLQLQTYVQNYSSTVYRITELQLTELQRYSVQGLLCWVYELL